MSVLVVIAWVGTGVALLGALHELANLRYFPILQPLEARRTERVVACVAARDEEQTIEGCLASLLVQPEIGRIVVCDDGSRDATRAVVEAIARTTERVLLIASTGTGKNAALATAAREAAALDPDVLLFVDADTRLDRGAVGALLAYRERIGADAASVWTRTVERSVWDTVFSQAVVLFLLQALSLGRAQEDPSPLFAAANGQVFLIERGAYDTCGGHGALSSIVEDVALARALKAAGFKIALASGARIAAALGYGSLAGNARGYGRSLLHGAGRGGAAFVATWYLFAFVLPWALLPFAPVPATLALAASLLGQAAVAQRLGNRRRLLVSWTVGAWVVCASAASTLFRNAPTRWRGRTHPLRS